MVATTRVGATWLPGTLELLAVGLLCLGGCGRDDGQDHPDTYPATGTVIAADGKPVGGGMIEFRSTAGKPLSALGVIGPDGTFELATMSGNRKLPGAVAGSHQVTVIPLAADGQDVQSTAEPVNLRAAVEVRIDGENHFTITLP
ncbi:MAG: hypothetical protein U1E05_04275 [Patescibacteria group bacterium]|nr:hypothetical protein [Patescibacteria group bacterium]